MKCFILKNNKLKKSVLTKQPVVTNKTNTNTLTSKNRNKTSMYQKNSTIREILTQDLFKICKQKTKIINLEITKVFMAYKLGEAFLQSSLLTQIRLIRRMFPQEPTFKRTQTPNKITTNPN